MLALLFAVACGGAQPAQLEPEDADVRDDDEGEDAADMDAASELDDSDSETPSGMSDAGADACTRDCGQQPADAATDAGNNADDAERPPNCVGLADTCGPKRDENCCTSLLVPAGTFWLGRRAGDPDDVCDAGMGATCFANEIPAVQATVRAFRLDRFEVTVGRFRKFVEAKAPAPAAGSGKHGYLNGGNEPGWEASFRVTGASTWNAQLMSCPYGTWTITAGSNESKPINCVPWDDAYAFCIWDGGFLPTEAEWEYAASGGEERLYPSNLNDACFGTSCLNPQPVGSYTGTSKWGHADLAGNSFEWVLDAYAPYSARCDDCANFTFEEPKRRISRGGGFSQPVTDERTVRRQVTPGGISGPYGMRCARRAE